MPGRVSMFVLAFGLMLSAVLGSAVSAGPRPAVADSVMGHEVTLLPILQVQMVQTKSGPAGTLETEGRCQTIRKCQYQRGGSFRGCISTYSCRVCKFVEARCDIGGRTENCREMRCTWG